MGEIFWELTYMANCAHISFDVSSSIDHLALNVSGYDDTLEDFLKEAIKYLTDWKSSQKIFDMKY